MFSKARSMLVLLLATFMVGLAACSGPEERKAQYLEKARTLMAEGNNAKAQLELRNVLQIDPKATDAYLMLAQIAEKDGDLKAAFLNFRKVTELDPTNTAAWLKVAHAYTFGGATEEARSAIAKVLEISPGNKEALTLQAALDLQKGDEEAALAQAQTLFDADPKLAKAALMLASIKAKKGDFASAVTILERARAASPQDLAVPVALADLFARAGEQDKAEAVLLSLVEHQPAEVSHRMRLADFYQRRGEADKAETVLRDVVALDPSDPARVIDLARFLAAKKGADAAEHELKVHIAARPKQHKLRFGLADFYVNEKRFDDAWKVYDELIADSDVTEVRLRATNGQAAIALQQNKLEEADRLIAQVLDEAPGDVTALELRGRRALAANKADDAIADFRAVIKQKPDSAQVLQLLAQAHMAAGQEDLAVDLLKRAVALNGADGMARLSLANLQLKQKDAQGALEQLDAVLAQAPDALVALELRVDALAQRQEWIEAEKTAARIQEKYPDRMSGYFKAAQVHESRKQFAQAAKEYEEAAKRAGRADGRAFLGMVRSLVADNQNDQALKHLRDLTQRESGNYIAQTLLGEVLLKTGDKTGATAAFEKAIAVEPGYAPPYRYLSALKSASGDDAGAVAILESGIQATKGATPLRLALASLHEKAGHPDAAIVQYEAMLAAEPASPLAANNLAMALAAYRDTPENLDRARRLSEPLQTSENPAFLDTVGYVRYKRGEYQQAIPIFEAALLQVPTAPLLRFHLGMAQYKAGDAAGARENLRQALNSEFPFAGREEAQSLLAELEAKN